MCCVDNEKGKLGIREGIVLPDTQVIRGLDARAVSLVRYGTGFIFWSKEELRNLNRKTRKLLSVYR